jgi:ketosteroid isomerase-like protein
VAGTATTHPNAALLVRLFDAFARRDGAVVVAALADDVVWRVGGVNAMAGAYRGRRTVVEFLRRTTDLTEGTYRSELRYALADDEHAVAVYRARGSRPDGREIDIDQVLLCRIEGGRRAEVVALPTDQAAFDAFWS